jgi:hypothetical protein
MAEAMVGGVESLREGTQIRVHLRRAYLRSRAVLPRRLVIRWDMRDNNRYYARAVAEAKARNASRDEIQSLEAEAAHFYWELEEEREMLKSNRLLRQAKNYFLEVPALPRNLNDPDDPNWRRGTTFKPNLYLTLPAMNDLQTRIRAERKALREPVGEWLKIVGGLGGVIYLVEKLKGLFG